ncbi:ATP-binding cassette domain-containing protein [Streptomyces sp. NPDC048516]|uniref:ATP-binding cassette domain-containing protein n=1 Tax=Streptomyces sp. NPDC048516 TaxID=3365565 RepID=UPI003722749A
MMHRRFPGRAALTTAKRPVAVPRSSAPSAGKHAAGPCGRPPEKSVHDALQPPPLCDTPRPLVRVRGLCKRFGGTLALDSVDLDIRSGRILALLGPNGAGKSTLIKVLAGVHPADEGEVSVAGHPLGTEAASRALSFIHQDLGLVDWMTVAENLALGAGAIPAARDCCRGEESEGSAPRPWTPSPRISIRTPRSPVSRAPNAPWWRSPAHCPTSRSPPSSRSAPCFSSSPPSSACPSATVSAWRMS